MTEMALERAYRKRNPKAAPQEIRDFLDLANAVADMTPSELRRLDKIKKQDKQRDHCGQDRGRNQYPPPRRQL
jgi:hypothetical protein